MESRRWLGRGISSDTIGSTLVRFTYALTDRDTNAVGGRTIRFAVSGKPSGAAGDTLINPLTTTDPATGEASIVLQLGNKVGQYIVSAEDPTIPSSKRLFIGNAQHGAIAKVNSFSSIISDTIGTTLPQFGMILADRGDNAVDGLAVDYRLANRPDSLFSRLSADSVLTDTLGMAPLRLTLGEKVGSYSVQATVPALPSLIQNYSFLATHGRAQNLLTERGQDQKKEILMPLDIPFEVRLTDRAGNPVANDTVFFALAATPSTAAGHALSAAIAVTDINGLASTRLTLGNKIGAYKVKATSPRLNIQPEFSAMASHGSARWIATASDPQQQKTILSALDTFAVKLTDIGGNPIPGSPVTFAVTDTPSGAWGYRLSNDTVWTDTVGIAKTVLTLGSKIGRYGVTARTPALPPDSLVRFQATALVGTAKTLAQESGEGQVGQIGNQINPFIVQVSDTGGNFVPHALVRFSVIQRPDSLAKFDSLSRSLDTTDVLGHASTVLKLGNRVGRYKVQASIPGVKDTVFSVDAIMLMADVNNDNFRNIGDLTAIIDHIIGRRVLTGYQFNKADMYPVHPNGTTGDGIVDIRDAQICRDSLLADKWVPTYDWTQIPASMQRKVSGGTAATSTASLLLTSSTDTCYVQTTHIGSRFSLRNTEPIKGLQAVIYLKNNAVLDTADVVFERAKMMRADVKGVGKEVSVILWNASNIPIEPGDSAIFRLPIQLTNNNVDSISVLVSTGSDNSVALINSKQSDIRNSIPREWMLYQNYPNPFNPSTTIEFDVPEVVGKLPRVAVQIFNILGQKVRTIERGIHDAGRYSVVWNGMSDNGTRIASGVYFYRMLAGEYASTKKMVMLK
jgi:hypothetical protein